ncbi:phosphoglycerate mutase [Candidatus Dojkabacteria bacterium CG_4_9_14_3_um_filter_150_Dojkabacteria_WS6_41_13]|uniref:2,3-bisphosphoglycerate-dependent phosphoglycerate mutase n=1 Tax=Candidatus Dojkabacteria bacterium CG_4_10_14_0_2_um_filter_Dojkabacteria_WS6_41_15 TaxID=2014249 RepID=A0A2M7W2W0_9BACT|nr:MAG: phosphoglycerate mutase [Candidatus Dojkabacteria bacterium CG_4_10_14_3_um_filter_Dojkabacteria_WS6_41_9]PJA15405.1 MAG: phosphoglycerate mutase [Candidatus Dojkabacteria bacterium CG_4_10_14_0_2_um_filter_Dojkabacteria_WS6_41_15]PJB22852.1 MAG: phosphoglycerate mutase [Candidatus Dojkabacteria bacterium CG_4_9_14_3_um_filter_150_Dojkabacteria_WS6_41_13]
MNSLVMVRHGQSRWNAVNRFTGWVDVTLSTRGLVEAQECGDKLKDTQFDVAFTSELIRAQQTLFTILSRQNKTGIVVHTSNKDPLALTSNYMTQEDIPIYETHKLNERHYGLLQGLDKAEVKLKYGEEQVINWRRGYKSKPPEGESLEDVFKRAVPYFKSVIMPFVSSGKNVIVSGHGNSLRAIVKYIENITDEQIVNLDLPTGEVIHYEFDAGQVSKRSGELSFERKVYWTPWVQRDTLTENQPTK